MIRRETIEILKFLYPKGTRVKLIQMDDPQAPPIGTEGTVFGVDDIGSILVSWDNGSTLNVIYGKDKCEKI
ncbi:MAG: DUF4314 domain-containing protein [Tissierellia bacterium]|nr:DUF4314 domain-containing protein [Tissierellia bacterium]